jgi:Methyltransferase domain
VLELGVRGGNSTGALLAGIEEHGGTLWSIDIDPASGEIFAGHPQWRFVLTDSRDVHALAAAGLPAMLDVLFFDTIHTYEQVRDELAAWGDRVRRGGLILFHDTDTYPEIRTAITEWCKPRRVSYEFLRRSNGLGVAYPGCGRLFGAWLLAVRTGRGLRWGFPSAASWLARLPKRVVRRMARAVRSRSPDQG